MRARHTARGNAQAGTIVMNLLRDGVFAVLAALWIAGLVQQFGSWPTTIAYVAISLVMAGLILGDRRVLRFAFRRNRRR
jgi:branched-subunit amino acid transport protein